METLQLYSIFERALLMVAKDLNRVLENRGFSTALNETKDFNYSMSLKTIYCHQYRNDPFVSDLMPIETEAFTHYFPQLEDESNMAFPILDFEFYGNVNNKNIPEIEIKASAYLLSDNETIELSIQFNPYNNLQSKTLKWKLEDWKKHLHCITQYFNNLFEKI